MKILLKKIELGKDIFTFEIIGKPIPLQRHRHYKDKCWDPQKKEKRLFKELFKIQTKLFTKGCFPAYSALKMRVEYHMPIPKSYSKRRALETLKKLHTNTPDLSNLIKFTEDALNEVAWHDDSLICEIEAVKLYSKEAKTVFKIEYLN